MKVELSGREIEVIVEYMKLGIAFLATHGKPAMTNLIVSIRSEKLKEPISVCDLIDRLKEEGNVRNIRKSKGKESDD